MEDAKTIPMVPESKKDSTFYGKVFSHNEYKYKVEDGKEESQADIFKKSEWYSEYEKMPKEPTQTKGGQSKNTTAKKNKSKRNKSKRNKSKKNK